MSEGGRVLQWGLVWDEDWVAKRRELEVHGYDEPTVSRGQVVEVRIKDEPPQRFRATDVSPPDELGTYTVTLQSEPWPDPPRVDPFTGLPEHEHGDACEGVGDA